MNTKKNSSEHIISWGGGVNSTAIIALHLLGELKGKPEIVFADTGCEYPETYAYINIVGNILHKDGWKVTILRPYIQPELYSKFAKETRTLTDACKIKKCVPHFKWRWCNDHFKKSPLRKYANGRSYLIGICKDEKHRIHDGKDIYPIKDYTRDECIELIKKAELPPAHKTGCYICPLQRKAQWIDMYKNKPNLWKECVEIENNSTLKFKHKITLEEQMKKWLAKESL